MEDQNDEKELQEKHVIKTLKIKECEREKF